MTFKDNQGAVLLIFVLIMVLASSSLLLKVLNLKHSSHQLGINQQVLSQAKQSLLGYAMRYADLNPTKLPGYLPCPDINGDGLSDQPCGVVGESSLGRLPWQTLGLKPLRDNAGECLWYAVSGAYKESASSTLSPDSNGQFLLFSNTMASLNGVNNSEIAIAVVFSAGSAVTNQSRSASQANATECGSSIITENINQSRQYLDSFGSINNANGSHTAGNILGLATASIPSQGISTFMHSGEISVQKPVIFNDSLIKISPVNFQLVYQHMQKRIAQRVRQCLVRYANNNSAKLPWPAILQGPGNPIYNDNNTEMRFGRIADNLINSGLNLLWPIDPDPNQLGTRCFNWSWWPNVQETVFIAIDNSIAPLIKAASTTLTVDGNPATAAIFIAGRTNVFNQNRITGGDKATLSNYLESTNIIDLGTGNIPPGNEDFISTDNTNVLFNDYVCTLNLCP